MRILMCVAALWHAGGFASDAISVSAGDVAGLVAAIEAVQTGQAPGNRVGLSSGTYVLGAHVRFPDITRETILIGGNAALLTTADFEPFPLFKIRPGARLVLEGIGFYGFGGHVDRGEGVIVNDGELIVTDVAFLNAFQRLRGGGRFLPAIQAAPIVTNRGAAMMSRVAFHDSGTDRAGGILTNDGGSAKLDTVHIAFLRSSAGGVSLNEAGTVTLVNTTIVGNGNIAAALDTAAGAETRLGNSVVSWRPAADCAGDGPTISDGHNTVFRSVCGLDATGDVESSVRLFPSSPRRWLGQQLALFIPSAAGPSVDSADRSSCAPVDLLGNIRTWDGDHDGVGGCDRGAVEMRRNPLAEGGANGVYFDPQSDGHYVTVVVNDFNTLVFWNTFDKVGNPAWIYATGELVGGHSYIGQAYTNDGGRLTEQGPPLGQAAEPWGTVQLELDSCDDGQFFYESTRPEFGQGQFRFRRLAVVRELGCADTEQPLGGN